MSPRKKVKVESWAEGYERRQREMAAQKRQAFTDRVMRLVAVLRVLERLADSVPLVEVAVAMGYGERDWTEREKLGVSLRRLAAMDMAAREKRKYESVVRWSLTEHGLAFLDGLADKAGADS